MIVEKWAKNGEKGQNSQPLSPLRDATHDARTSPYASVAMFPRMRENAEAAFTYAHGHALRKTIQGERGDPTR